MRAAVVHSFDQPLRSRTCRSLKSAPGRSWSGSRPAASATPIFMPPTATRPSSQTRLIPGHEGVGIVEQVGSGVPVAEGDRVAIPWLGYACGACEYCASGRETLCPNQQDGRLHGRWRLRRLRGSGMPPSSGASLKVSTPWTRHR